ncbi:MAG: hypothetical protein CMD92_00245 [Gammaproteobacteria bacterium]|nr:hypothetical protein [Gammaproteobacteria bacterium]
MSLSRLEIIHEMDTKSKYAKAKVLCLAATRALAKRAGLILRTVRSFVHRDSSLGARRVGTAEN